MAAPIDGQTCHPNHPAGKTVLQHRTPVISERLSKSAVFIDSNQSIQLRWGDFFSLVSRLSRRFIFPAKSLVPTGTAFTVCPAYRFPVIPGRLNFLRWCQPTSSRYAGSNLSFAGILFLILFRGNLSCYIQNRKFNLSLMNLFILVWKNYYPLLFVVTFLNLNNWTVCFVLNVMTVQILSRQNFFSLMMNFNGEDI